MTYIGIDPSQEYFDAMLLMPGGKKHHAQFKNSEKGLVQFDNWVKKYRKGDRHVCMVWDASRDPRYQNPRLYAHRYKFSSSQRLLFPSFHPFILVICHLQAKLP